MAKRVTKTYLIAHTAKDGTNVGQAKYAETSEGNARAAFREDHPDRDIQMVRELVTR